MQKMSNAERPASNIEVSGETLQMMATESEKVPDTALRLLARSPNQRRPVVMHHRWENLLFLHWCISAARIQETLPDGLTVDTFEGDAWLGIVPFFMANVRVVGTPSLPWFSFFQELNVRTYAFDRHGTPGVWFYSLDCNRAWATLGARILSGLSYFNANMKAARGRWIDYMWRRRGAAEIGRYVYRGVGELNDCAPESVEFFLLERYYLFSQRGRALLRGQVAHPPYRYRAAELAGYSLGPARLDGFTELVGEPAHTCFVDGLDVNVYAQEKV